MPADVFFMGLSIVCALIAAVALKDAYDARVERDKNANAANFWHDKANGYQAEASEWHNAYKEAYAKMEGMFNAIGEPSVQADAGSAGGRQGVEV